MFDMIADMIGNKKIPIVAALFILDRKLILICLLSPNHTLQPQLMLDQTDHTFLL